MINPNDPVGMNARGALAPADLPKEWQGKIRELVRQTNGLTKREYFAAMLMNSLVTDKFLELGKHPNLYATRALALADALIEELSK